MSFFNVPEVAQPSPSSHVAMHGVLGIAPNSVGEDDNHPQLHIHFIRGIRLKARSSMILSGSMVIKILNRLVNDD